MLLNNLKMKHMLTLINRYNINPIYLNPQNRKKAIKKILEKYWKKNPEKCVICFEFISMNNGMITPCSHIFCDICLVKQIHNNETCPLCRKSVSYIDIISQLPKESYYTMNIIHIPNERNVQRNELILHYNYYLIISKLFTVLFTVLFSVFLICVNIFLLGIIFSIMIQVIYFVN